MTRALVAVAVVLAIGATAAGVARPAALPGAAADVRRLAAEMERIHPNLFHAVPRARFRRAANELAARAPTLDRDELLVEVMRLMAMTGERDGHMGLFPLVTTHARPLHLLPIRLWLFPEGVYVIAAPGRPELVGTRVVAVESTGIDELVAKVRPLIARDNAWDRLAKLPIWLVTSEILHGLGVTSSAGGARVTVERPGGERLDADLRAVTAQAYTSLVRWTWAPNPPPNVAMPQWLRNPSRTQWLTTLDGGRVVYAVYSHTEDATSLAQNLLRRARSPRVRRVIVDVRLNGGGDNTSYGTLLNALRHPSINRRGRLVLLTGRLTFSAAGNFAAEVEASTRARIVGEPPGGSPHNYGDSSPVELRALEWTVYVPPQYVQVLGRRDTRAVLRPDVSVPFGAADWFAGRDPVLERAISLP